MAPPTKSSAKTKIITLSLSTQLLRKFPSDSSSSSTTKDRSSPSSSNVDSTAPGAGGVDTPDIVVEGVVDGDENENGDSPSKPELKRNASQMTIDGLPKAKGKPGPKKKMKVDGPNGSMIPVNAPKMNPKASAGAINANLRALDRSGAQCRKWNRAPFQIRSFTGASWYSSSTWEAPAKPKPQTDENGNPTNGSVSGSNTPSDAVKANRDSSAVASERSQNGDTTLPAAVAMSSPAPVAVA